MAANSEPSDDLAMEDTVEPPTESFTLVIEKADPEALDLARAAATESGIDEIVLLPPPRFPLHGLQHLRSFIAERIKTSRQPFAELRRACDNLRAGELTAITVDRRGAKETTDPDRWRARDAEEILRTGRLDDADVYIVIDPGAAGVERPAWHPQEHETLKVWCTRQDVEDVARERIKADGGTPYERAICRELEKMRRSAGVSKGTVGSIEQARREVRLVR